MLFLANLIIPNGLYFTKMHHQNISVRHASIADLPILQSIFANTIAATCLYDYTPEQITVWVSAIENKQKWLQKLKAQYFIVAQYGKQIVGYASLENYEYLDFLYVHNNYQRQGIAYSLYSMLEKEAIKNQSKAIHAHVSITARPFFEKVGFELVCPQTNIIKGIEILNFKMKKQLH
jgi:putative acetyltransferase